MNLNELEKQILIVDDDLIDRMYIERFCTKNHLNFLSATDGEEALNLIHKGAVTLVFSDIDMPKLSGIELVQTIRMQETDSKKHLVVAAVSGNESLALNQNFKQLGFDYFIPKPAKYEQLNLIISQVLGFNK
jgi:CheY-like chemotaxis protein